METPEHLGFSIPSPQSFRFALGFQAPPRRPAPALAAAAAFLPSPKPRIPRPPFPFRPGCGPKKGVDCGRSESLRLGNQSHAESRMRNPAFGAIGRAIRRSTHGRVSDVPGSASQDPGRSLSRSLRVAPAFKLESVTVPTPFPEVAMHVVESSCVRLLLSNRMGRVAVGD